MNKKLLLFLLMLIPWVVSAQTNRTIHVKVAGTLSDSIPEEEKYQIEELTLSGELNGTDICFIRDMAGTRSYGTSHDGYVHYESTDGKLKSLNLSEANIVRGGGGYITVPWEPSVGTCTEDCYDELYTSDNSISHLMFYLTKLESIVIPKSVTSVASDAFSGCDNLTSIKVDNNTIFDSRDDCNAIIETSSNILIAGCKNTTIPNGVTSIGNYAFNNCSLLTSVTIPNSVTSIGDYAFSQCSGLTSLTIPNSVTSIGKESFSGCSGLTSIVSEIEDPFAISDNVFYCNDRDIYATVTLIVPLGKKSVYQNTAGWKKFQNVIEDGGVGFEFEDNGIRYSIGENNAVSVIQRSKGYSGDIVIPSQVTYHEIKFNVTSIGSLAFGQCSGLTSIAIPSSVTRIGEDAFKDCNGLTAVHISDLEAWLKVFIAEGQLSIGEDASVDCSSSPLYYAHHLFLNGEEVKELVIPNTITKINNHCCDGWSALTSVAIPNSVTSIGYEAFLGCSGLTYVTIPNSVTSIEGWAFGNCNGLTTVVSEIEVPFAIDENVFNCSDKEIYTTASLIVPPGMKSAYQNTAGWNKFQTIIEGVGFEFEADGIRYVIGENNTVSVISRESNYSGDIVIPSQVAINGSNYDVTAIGSSAFEGCVELKSVSIPSSVLTIGAGAFYYCTGLTTVDIPNGVTTIGEGAFSKCAGLTSVTIPGSVTSIGSNAFFQCYSLTQITSGIENPFAIDNGVFPTNVYNEASLIVPSGKKSAYLNTAGWKRFQKIYHADGIYTLTYYVDGEEYKSVKYSFGSEITPEAEPAKKGFTFSGWSDVPKIMPADDVTVIGTFTANKYNLTYKVDGEIYQTYELEYGAEITPEPAPTKEGYTFSGWSYIPETMPAEEVNVFGSFTINQYTITYMIDGEKYDTVTVDFNSKIVPPTPPSKDGFDFAWEEYPETMPAHDITINGAYTTTGILSIAVESGKAKIFTLDGRQVDTPQKGINIIRMDDGTIKKVVFNK